MTRHTDRPHLHDLRLSSEIGTAKLAALLRDEQRRRVLRRLDADEGTVALSTLTDRLADGEEARDRIALRLHHVHLPKLAEYGLLSYDSDRNLVTADARPEWVEPYLEG